jgi:hypothetical protein
MNPDDQRVVAALEERVRVLSAGLGLDGSFEVPVEVRRLIEDGETVRAVRELRQRAPGRLSLVAAKRMGRRPRPEVAADDCALQERWRVRGPAHCSVCLQSEGAAFPHPREYPRSSR